MKILVVGVGAVGGYFGGRLIEKGEDVTFLVREKRQQQLNEQGLNIQSVHGDFHYSPKTIQTNDQSQPFDVIILSTKAYHLKGAIESISPFVGDETMILPLLNGISHVDELIHVFGEEKVIGGLCFVESTLDDKGTIIQSSPIHDVVFGERDGKRTERITRLEEAFSNTKAKFSLSSSIVQEMWHKYLFITTLSGVTSLFRAPIGPIRENDKGKEIIQNVLSQTASIMRSINAPIGEQIEEALFEKLNQMGYTMKSSLQRDMEKSLPIEAKHLYGYLVEIADNKGIPAPELNIIYSNLQIYETENL